jgi:hypothetical protein
MAGHHRKSWVTVTLIDFFDATIEPGLSLGSDLLRLNPDARLFVANVEMAPTLLVERIVSRLAAVPLTAIADRALTDDQLKRVRAAIGSLAPVAARTRFCTPPSPWNTSPPPGPRSGRTCWSSTTSNDSPWATRRKTNANNSKPPRRDTRVLRRRRGRIGRGRRRPATRANRSELQRLELGEFQGFE